MFFAIVVAGLAAYVSAVDWYRVVDRAEIAALDHLKQDARFADVVVAAGSVVRFNLPDNAFAAGNPAVVKPFRPRAGGFAEQDEE